MKKAIVFLRVSTSKQTLEQQEALMLSIARQTYKDDEIVIIKGTESATKLSFDERKTLTALFDTIKENKSIERIYCFAVDRLARKATIVNQTVKDLANMGVDVYFHYPYQLHSLDAEGKLSLMADLMLYFLGVGAEQETLLRNERVQAKREIMKANGQLIVGKPCYGYTIDKDNHIIVNEEEAKWVRYVVIKYANGESSLKQLSDELVTKGVLPNGNYSTRIERIRAFVVNGSYSGREPLRKGSCNVYPPIISPELQDKAREVAKNNRHTPKKESKHIYYGKSLIRTDYNDHAMIPSICNKVYKTTNSDTPSYSVSINAVDTAIWRATRVYYSYNLVLEGESNKEAYLEEISSNKLKIDNIKAILSDLETQQARIFKQYVKGNVKESLYESEMSGIRKQTEKWNKDIATLESTNAQLESLINNAPTRDNISEFIPDDATDEHRKEIVNKLWHKFVISKEGTHYIMRMYLKRNPTMPLKDYFEYWNRGGCYHLLYHRMDNTVVDLSKDVIRRF